MSTQREPRFSLVPIIHLASEDERKSAAMAPSRYWLRDGGELSREPRPMGLRFSNDQCFIIRAGEMSGKARMVIETTLPLAGTSWQVPALASIAFTCPPMEVHRLIQRWTAASLTPEGADTTLVHDVTRELRAATADCDEHALLAAVGVAGGGVIGERLKEPIRRNWGLVSDLWLTLREADANREVRIETTVRLADVEAECKVLLVVDLRPSTESVLRSLALLNAETNLQGVLADKVQRFYADNVAVDQLLDPRRRSEWRTRLEGVIQQFAGAYGCEARILQLSEVPPALPGELDELVAVTIPHFAAADERAIEITMVARLRLTSAKTLLVAMAPRAGATFSSVFEPIARSVLSYTASEWTADDLRISTRDELNRVLEGALESFAPTYGYELVRCVVATSMDPAPAPENLTVSWSGAVATADDMSTVDVRAEARIAFRLGARGRVPEHELSDLIAGKIRKKIADRLSQLTPSAIFRRWAVSNSELPPLRDRVLADVTAELKTYADDPDITVELDGADKFLIEGDRVLRSGIVRTGVRLNDGHLIDDVVVDLQAPITEIGERAWAEIGRGLASGERWDPAARASAVLERLLQRRFALYLRERRQQVVLKSELVENLKQALNNELLEMFGAHFDIDIHIQPSPDVVAFAKSYRRDRKLAEREFEIREVIGKTIHAKALERLRLIGEGLFDQEEVKELDAVLRQLGEEDVHCEGRLLELHARMTADYDHVRSAFHKLPLPDGNN